MRTIDQILGSFDPVWDECQPRGVRLDHRNGNDIYCVAHHSVSTTLQSIEATFKSPNRSVSANAGVGPLFSGRDEYTSKQYVPWRTHRAYTTASWIDDQAITFEMADLRLEYPWPIGSTGLRWFAELVAAMHVELGMPIDTYHVLDHATVHGRGWGSYATQCAGDYMRARINDYVIPTAKQIVADHNKPPVPKEDIMRRFAFRDDRDRKLPKGEWITVYLNEKNDASFASGKCLGNVNVYLQLSGLAVGEGLKVRLMKTKVGTSELRGAIAAREIPGTTGTTYATVPIDFELFNSDDGIRVQVASDSEGVTLLRADVSGLVQP